jgi:hypothetical protein
LPIPRLWDVESRQRSRKKEDGPQQAIPSSPFYLELFLRTGILSRMFPGGDAYRSDF